ncbi:MAG TPA: CCA tRNA nucleotidyltransferase [Terriglobales bacterium]|nr:CCA tRNA nucleotidyltransferase [Terriglobales bacterium]
MSQSLRSAATRIVRALRDAGHQAYLVGGCVRDIVLGREPQDFDVSTDATPEQVMALFPQTYEVGARFGVVLVPVEHPPATSEATRDSKLETPNQVIEVATFRSDGLYTDGRHPDQVTYTRDPREDVARRDFTINGLLLDPLEDDKVLDFVGGRADLEAGIIRAIGEPGRRFAEDKLRMLRAVRFAARFAYSIEPCTLAAIGEHAREIHKVSRERVRDELVKMLTEGHARRAFELLDTTGLLAEVLPEVAAMKGVAQPPQFHPEGDVWVHTLMLLEGLKPGCSPTLALGALLHDVGKPPTFRVAPDRIRFDGHAEVGTKMAEEICRRFRFSNDQTEQVCALVANHLRFIDVPRMKQSTLKRFLRLPQFEEHLELHRLDCLASHGDLSVYELVKQKLVSTPPEQIRPKPLLTGDDLIAAGYVPSPRFKEILRAVEDAQLEGTLADKPQALEFVRRTFPP